jgi:hypothetical protein
MKLVADLLLWLSAQWWAPVAELVFWTWYFAFLFSSYAAFHRARREGTFRPEHWFVFSLVIAQGWPLDIVWNSTLGAALFGEWPWENWDWTFTARVAKHLNDTDWRGTVARRLKVILNGLDPGHL